MCGASVEIVTRKYCFRLGTKGYDRWHISTLSAAWDWLAPPRTCSHDGDAIWQSPQSSQCGPPGAESSSVQ